ncbi:hypothetical protein EJ08DRAFT_695860 [Tothia fuscella]|uniref:Uncharacterized protein n=1 Tax=Tothia fuscella TaxID=1048955 RepID=A0A9P4NUS7_9PEZI|nr:hypothetical protein EJ08DRAFT_695860 [Tothia fuscella]
MSDALSSRPQSEQSTSTAAGSHDSRISFFTLPRELRDMIYHDLFRHETVIRNPQALNGLTNIFLASKQVQQETQELFYATYYPHVKFDFIGAPSYLSFMKTVGLHHPNFTGRLRIFLPGGETYHCCMEFKPCDCNPEPDSQPTLKETANRALFRRQIKTPSGAGVNITMRNMNWVVKTTKMDIGKNAWKKS